ncbi:hypothetical protein GSbR_32070 [Geobacter sp. SVR]|nr:hypothetical protein GSVR_04600 [Geobacter sp. SVR]GCF86607.1 hypothetical protein GSbR_32070 [Geobacter sp. SVR]
MPCFSRAALGDEFFQRAEGAFRQLAQDSIIVGRWYFGPSANSRTKKGRA